MNTVKNVCALRSDPRRACVCSLSTYTDDAKPSAPTRHPYRCKHAHSTASKKGAKPQLPCSHQAFKDCCVFLVSLVRSTTQGDSPQPSLSTQSSNGGPKRSTSRELNRRCSPLHLSSSPSLRLPTPLHRRLAIVKTSRPPAEVAATQPKLLPRGLACLHPPPRRDNGTENDQHLPKHPLHQVRLHDGRPVG